MQDPTDAATRGLILSGIQASSDIGPFDEFRGAVAYASAAGVAMLTASLGDGYWCDASKQWLVSIDFGHTEPNALFALMELPYSSVRVPNGRLVVSSPRFKPTPNSFHPKIYIFGQRDPQDAPLGIFSGSANLTKSGLQIGYESGTISTWYGAAAPGELAEQMAARDAAIAGFEQIWARATPAEEIAEDYQHRRQELAPPPQSEEESVEELLGPPGPKELSEDLTVAFATAWKFWVKTDGLYHNLTTRDIGNQLDLPRGTRVFFGFPATEVPLNYHFGPLMIQCEGHQPTERTMRFGNNAMDKLNLPVPGEEGPPSYDNSILLFERQGFSETGMSQFYLRLISQAQLDQELAVRHLRLHMAGGREYGVIY
jgi:hypothetical protein